MTDGDAVNQGHGDLSRERLDFKTAPHTLKKLTCHVLRILLSSQAASSSLDNLDYFSA